MATADLEVPVLDEHRIPAEPRRERGEPEVNKLFRMVMKHEGSDLHLKVGLPPMMRLKGLIRQMSMPVIELVVSFPVPPCTVRNIGPSVISATRM